jgi:hypothetical protein
MKLMCNNKHTPTRRVAQNLIIMLAINTFSQTILRAERYMQTLQGEN